MYNNIKTPSCGDFIIYEGEKLISFHKKNDSDITELYTEAINNSRIVYEIISCRHTTEDCYKIHGVGINSLDSYFFNQDVKKKVG